jgi:FlaG/FlaF family flagellin (archaellin)
MDDRAVSAVLGYILTLAVMTLLVSGLFLAAGNFVENQHERAIRAELEVVGNRLAADIAAVDRMALASGAVGEAELQSDMPELTAGQSYLIEISESGTAGVYFLNASTDDPDVEVSVRVRAETDLVEGTVNGGDVTVVFNGTAMEVRDG